MKSKKRKSNRELRELAEEARINRNPSKSCNVTAEESKEILLKISQLLNNAGVKGDVEMLVAPCLCDIIPRVKYLLFDLEATHQENLHLLEMLKEIQG